MKPFGGRAGRRLDPGRRVLSFYTSWYGAGRHHDEITDACACELSTPNQDGGNKVGTAIRAGFGGNETARPAGTSRLARSDARHRDEVTSTPPAHRAGRHPSRARDAARISYLAQVVPGLEVVARDEMRQQLAELEVIDMLRRFDERTGLLLFQTGDPASQLLTLRTVEDVFAVLLDVAVPSVRPALHRVHSLLAASGAWERALAAAREARPGKGGRMTFRVIARMAGEHGFRRVDLQRAVESGIQERFPAWRPVGEAARVEVWAHLVRGRLVAALRLSDSTLRHRSYYRATLPAALKPTIAAAMVFLSEPRPDDVFLDPMCGSGTIVVERAQAGRYTLLLAGDSDAAALAAARENVGRRYKPIRIERWDARHLPVDAGSVTTLVGNLPFGKRIGS
ncbi:MAG TPA: hypothetical protein VKX16_13745, partial [Chloroflexota bacterium]|nr:hypothetical protein [Chloroflexota bacterium]